MYLEDAFAAHLEALTQQISLISHSPHIVHQRGDACFHTTDISKMQSFYKAFTMKSLEYNSISNKRGSA